MGATYIDGTVTGPTGKTATTRFLVDSGATYTLLPKPDWEEIGLQPKRTVTFALADGTTIERRVTEDRRRTTDDVMKDNVTVCVSTSTSTLTLTSTSFHSGPQPLPPCIWPFASGWAFPRTSRRSLRRSCRRSLRRISGCIFTRTSSCISARTSALTSTCSSPLTGRRSGTDSRRRSSRRSFGRSAGCSAGHIGRCSSGLSLRCSGGYSSPSDPYPCFLTLAPGPNPPIIRML